MLLQEIFNNSTEINAMTPEPPEFNPKQQATVDLLKSTFPELRSRIQRNGIKILFGKTKNIYISVPRDVMYQPKLYVVIQHNGAPKYFYPDTANPVDIIATAIEEADPRK